jgi:class 3 adenylate cyclase
LVISSRADAVGYRRNEADIRAVCKLAEALRDAIVEYQVRVGLNALD